MIDYKLALMTGADILFDDINSTQDFYVNKLIINKLFIKFS